MTISKRPSAERASSGGRQRRIGRAGSVLAFGLLCVASLAQAQTQTPAAPATGGDDAISWKGLTLYGIIDIGLQYQNHGVPESDYFPPGTEELIQKNANKSVTGIVPSGLSQTRIGLSGKEPLAGDWNGVFRLETFFNPQSGELSDGLKSVALNNGRALDAQNTGVDTSVAGQIFTQAYVGFSSQTYGTVTFGRQNTIFADAISKYDPMGASQAFSVIGFSGTAAGGGDTEDRRLDSSLKYVGAYGPVHLGGQYKFNGSHGEANTAWEFQIGADLGGLSVDAYYLDVKDAVSAGALSAAQVADLPTLGFSPSNSISGTISDNRTYAITALYNLGAPKLYAGWEHIRYSNPSNPLPVGFVDIGGYILAAVNNAAFPNDKVLQVYWGGVKFTVAPRLDLIAAFYGYHQNSYANGANTGCTTIKNAACSGTLSAGSIAAVLKLSKRFDVYGGAMYSTVSDGLANGYLNTSTIDPTIGVRFKF